MTGRTAWVALGLLAVAPLALAEEPAHADSPRVLEVLTREAQEVLLEADHLEVMAIECERDPAPGEDALRGYPVEKRAEVPAREDRVRLLSRLYQGLDEAREPAVCFEPHHAVRATKGGRVVELIVCFKCSQMIAAGAGVRTPPRGRYVAISSAAADELERLIGEREHHHRVAGRPLHEWWTRLHRLGSAPGGPRIEPEDEAGVLAVADALGRCRSGRTARGCAEALRALGPAALPALPALRWHVEADLRRPACQGALRVIESIGPEAAPAALGVLTRLREALQALPSDDRRMTVCSVAEAAVRALGAIGPAAAEAVPVLERLVDHRDLGQAARQALERIRR